MKKSSTPSKRSFLSGKRAFYWLVLIGIVLVCLELTMWVALSLLRGGVATYDRLHDERSVLLDIELGEIRASSGAATSDETRILHPYVGYVHGNKMPELLVPKDAKNTFTIVVVGGSVARNIGKIHPDGPDALMAELKNLPQLEGKTIRFLNLAGDGYRQPQQLLLANYLLTLGAKIDLFVNLDGFNELYVPENNRQLGGFQTYPELWTSRMSWLMRKSQSTSERLFDILMLQRFRLASVMQRAPLKYSMTANFFWSVLETMLRKQVLSSAVRPGEAIQRMKETYGPVTASGADIGGAALTESAEIWERSSSLLSALASSQGIAYFHFLQPNQYFPKSKPMGEEERAKAIGDFFWKGIVENGYPLLQQAGMRLQRKGVHFYDMTLVFKDISEPLYIDNIGHFDRHGEAILGKAMGEKIVEVLKERP
ncbi:MAG: hypothetical protein PHH13_01160 [Candidatus Peribacteraceae bacterium]|nr:hypothetical protein [Candidatus Peribacteraceae bacterium]